MPSYPSTLTWRQALALFAAPLKAAGHQWTIDGRSTYPGAEGVLLNQHRPPL